MRLFRHRTSSATSASKPPFLSANYPVGTGRLFEQIISAQRARHYQQQMQTKHGM
jgi:hypothetical protein